MHLLLLVAEGEVHTQNIPTKTISTVVSTVTLREDTKHTETYKELKPDVYVETQTNAHGNREVQLSRLVTGQVQYLIHFASSQKTAWNKC